jgi:hypothetical protein
MLAKYTVEYSVEFRKHAHSNHYTTDDPVACEEFLLELLERKYPIKAVKHEGVDVSRHDFDKMIKTAGGMLAAKHICASLHIDMDEEKYRFGFSV